MAEGTDYVLSWKSKRVYNSKLKLLYTSFLHCINLFEYRIGIKFDKESLGVKQNDCLIKIANVYIVYDLDAWLRNPTNSFKFKNCLFGTTNIARSSDVYSGYGITFDSAGLRNFGYHLARDVVIFSVDKSLLSHADSRKNNCLVLGEGPT